MPYAILTINFTEVRGVHMPKIQWDDSFSVNNDELDNQHKKWIEILNTLHDSLVAKDVTFTKNSGAEALEAMHEYALNHFSFEEEYMSKIDYPEVVAHRRIHKDFDTLIYSYNRDIREGNIVLNTEIIKLMENWLLDHILIEDKKFALFAEGKK